MSLHAELRDAVAELDERIEALTLEAKPVRDQLANMDRTISKLRNERAAKAAKLAELKEKPRVSDHAVIRYLEREYGFTFEDIREKLLTPFVLAAMDAGAEAVQLNGGTLKIKGRTVVTYVD